MKKTILWGIIGVWLMAVLPLCPAVSEKIFREPKSPLEEKVLRKVKDEFGWNKKVVEQRLTDGTYTETEITKFIEKSCREVADEEANKLFASVVTPKPLDITPVKLDVIELSNLAVSLNTAIETVDLNKLATLINSIPIETIDVDKLVRLFEQAYGFAIDQREFYEAWEKRDVKALAKIIQSAKPRQLEFFTAWGNYQDFSAINFGRHEPLQNRQVLVSSLNSNWRNLFKPVSPNIILTINFGLSNYEIKALLELIGENRSFIKAVILPWGSDDVNNFDNRNTSTYSEVAGWCDRLAYSIREVAPEIPIGLTVCVCPTLNDWVSSFHFPYDFLNVWNILNSDRANLKKVYEMLSPYNKTLILSTFQCNPDAGGWIPFTEARKITIQSLDRVKESGFSGIILMTNSND